MDEENKDIISIEEKEGIIEYFKKRLSFLIENKEKEFNDVIDVLSKKIDALWNSFEEERKKRFSSMQNISRENAMLSNELKRENIKVKEYISEKEKEFELEKSRFMETLSSIKKEVAREKLKWTENEQVWKKEKKELLSLANNKDEEARLLRDELFKLEKKYKSEIEIKEKEMEDYKSSMENKIKNMEIRITQLSEFKKNTTKTDNMTVPEQDFPSSIKELKDYLDKKGL